MHPKRHRSVASAGQRMMMIALPDCVRSFVLSFIQIGWVSLGLLLLGQFYYVDAITSIVCAWQNLKILPKWKMFLEQFIESLSPAEREIHLDLKRSWDRINNHAVHTAHLTFFRILTQLSSMLNVGMWTCIWSKKPSFANATILTRVQYIFHVISQTTSVRIQYSEAFPSRNENRHRGLLSVL